MLPVFILISHAIMMEWKVDLCLMLKTNCLMKIESQPHQHSYNEKTSLRLNLYILCQEDKGGEDPISKYYSNDPSIPSSRLWTKQNYCAIKLSQGASF